MLFKSFSCLRPFCLCNLLLELRVDMAKIITIMQPPSYNGFKMVRTPLFLKPSTGGGHLLLYIYTRGALKLSLWLSPFRSPSWRKSSTVILSKRDHIMTMDRGKDSSFISIVIVIVIMIVVSH